MEEFLAVVVIILPGVFAVQDDADNVRAGGVLIGKLLADIFQPLHHVRGRGFASHTRVGEADFVGQHAVTEEHRQLVAVRVGDVVGTVKIIRFLHGFLAVAREAVDAKRFGQHRLARGHPLVTRIDDVRHRGLGNRAFSRPQPGGGLAKILLVDFHAFFQVHHRILRILEAGRHFAARVAHQRQLRVDQQR